MIPFLLLCILNKADRCQFNESELVTMFRSMPCMIVTVEECARPRLATHDEIDSSPTQPNLCNGTGLSST